MKNSSITSEEIKKIFVLKLLGENKSLISISSLLSALFPKSKREQETNHLNAFAIKELNSFTP